MFLKHVHNLFTRALWLPSPAGLRLEISCESDKKKMNLIFNYDKKFPLTEKVKHACRRKRNNGVWKIFARRNRDDCGIAATNRPRCRSSAHPELTVLTCAGNFSPLRARQTL